MRVLLIPPKNNYPDPRPSRDIIGQGFPYIAGALKQAGHEIYGLNINTGWCQGSAQVILESSLRKAIERYNPHLIGVGGQSADYSFIRDAISFIRQIQPHIPIVCGGGIVTYDQHFIFSNLRPDFAVIGEGEETIIKLTDCLENGGDGNTISNIAFWENNEPVYTKIEYSNKCLDDLPFPDYSPFDYKSYLDGLNQTDNGFYAHTRHHPRVLPVSLGRSCPFDCTFCCHTAGPKYRERSIDSAIEEIIHFYDMYRFNILFIYDELFAMKKKRIMEFCSKIKKIRKELNMDFDWTCALRVNHVDREVLSEMKSAGCIFIGYGFESASPIILKSMKKRITVDQILNAIKLTDEVGIGVQGNFILGDITETTETLEETKIFFDKWCKNLMIHFNYLTPYPGSEIFEYCINKGIIKDKQEYYDNIGTIGKYKINMTQIPDDSFFSSVDNTVSITDPLMYNQLKLKEGLFLSCKKKGQYKSDSDAPSELRRSLFKINVVCPHCLEEVDYLFPLNNSKEVEAQLHTYCVDCHKRFVVTVSNQSSSSALNTISKIKGWINKRLIRRE